MACEATRADIAAAEAYETLHVPALFGQWSPRLLRAVDAESPDRLLDVACGTGILARTAMTFVAPDGFVAGLDASPGMLAVARRLDPAIEWRLGSASELPWAAESFDIVACQFGLMFFPDRRAALREMWRVLKPGGRLVVATWDALERADAYREEVALLERFAGLEAANALRAPFALGEPAVLVELFQSAGISDVKLSTRTGRGQFPDIRTLVSADLYGWLPVMGVELSEDQAEIILGAAHKKLARYLDDHGRVRFDAPAHIVTAVRH